MPGCSPSSWIGSGSLDSTSHVRSAEQLRLRVRQVCAAEDLRHREQEIPLRQVADQQHVERAVVQGCVRADLHPAAEVRPVGDDDVVHAGTALLGADRNVDLAVRPAREDGERRPDVGHFPPERLRRVVGTLRDRAAHAGAADVREPGDSFGPVPAPVGRAAEVDRRGRFRRARRRSPGPGCAGCRASGRSPSPCRGGSRRSRRPRAARSRSRPRARNRRRRRRRAALRPRPLPAARARSALLPLVRRERHR